MEEQLLAKLERKMQTKYKFMLTQEERGHILDVWLEGEPWPPTPRAQQRSVARKMHASTTLPSTLSHLISLVDCCCHR